MSLTCRGDPKDTPDLANFYAFVAALYHRWHKILWPGVAKIAPYMCSIAIYKTDSLETTAILIGNSIFRYKLDGVKEIIKKLQRNDLKDAGFEPVMEKDEVADNYGNCAETDQWIVSKQVPSFLISNHLS